MILLFEENPKLITYLDIEKEEENQDLVFSSKHQALGSKGLVGGKILRQADVAHKILLPLGGAVGRRIKEFAREEDLSLVDLEIKDASQEEFVLRGEKSLKIRSREPRLTQEEKDRLYSHLLSYHEEIKNLVLFSGKKEEEDKYPYFLERSHALGHKTFVEVNHDLGPILSKKPYLLVCKKDQVENFTGLRLNFAHEVEKAGKLLIEAGARACYILGSKGVDLYAGKDKNYRIYHPDQGKIDPGILTLGLAMGQEKKYNPDFSLRYAVALAQEDWYQDGEGDLVKIKQNMNQIEVKEEKKNE